MASPESPTHRISPDHKDTGWPKGVPYIIGNEGCERFSYYGMRAILTVFLMDTLYKTHPQFGVDPKTFAEGHYHIFAGAVYFFPLLGAVVADRLLGKYRTILWLSMVYVAGHATLAMFEHSVTGFWIGLGLIAVGSGGIKPCVSAHVGDQFGKGNWFRVQSVFQAFYFIINFGSFFATLAIPTMLEKFGPSVAFGIPGILMAIATVFFWMGRKVFVHVPPNPAGKIGLLDAASSGFLVLAFGHLFMPALFHEVHWYYFAPSAAVCIAIGLLIFSIRQRIEQDDGFFAVMFYSARVYLGGEEHAEAKAEVSTETGEELLPAVKERREKLVQSRFFGAAARRFGIEAAEGPPAVLRIISIFGLVSVFWALFDQHGSTWVTQAKTMDLSVGMLGIDKALPNQIAAANPLMVMALIPITNFGLYPLLEKFGLRMTPLRRMTAGMLMAAFSFVTVAFIQIAIDSRGHGQVHFTWQLLPFVIITLAEVMVSITGLEFAYTQAPKRMKSTVMGFWLATVSIGNLLVSLLKVFGGLAPVTFFWVFAGLMGGAGVLFGIRAYFYTPQEYVQD